MAVIVKKPTTPGERFRIANRPTLSKVKPAKRLCRGMKNKAGRNNAGQITMPHRGGGHKRLQRIVDFRRRKDGIPATVKFIEYDPNRTAFIARISYRDGDMSYIIACKGLEIGDQVLSGEKIPPKIGNAMPLGAMPVGTLVHNVEFNPGGGASLARSAGTYVQLVAIQEKNVVLRLPSGERRMVNKKCRATVGVVSNSDHASVILGKAGRNRWKRWRPTVRKRATNACDGPLGGGEPGSGSTHPMSKNRIYSQGQRTRKRKKYSTRMILKRRK
ncbi:MAG: 50S ribosomal protein L2 [Cytophagales bacterium]